MLKVTTISAGFYRRTTRKRKYSTEYKINSVAINNNIAKTQICSHTFSQTSIPEISAYNILMPIHTHMEILNEYALVVVWLNKFSTAKSNIILRLLLSKFDSQYLGVKCYVILFEDKLKATQLRWWDFNQFFYKKI